MRKMSSINDFFLIAEKYKIKEYGYIISGEGTRLVTKERKNGKLM